MDTKRLHEVVCAAVRDVRSNLAFMESYASFDLRICAKGRVHDGEVLVSYSLDDDSYRGKVVGNDLDATLAEYMRRRGWDARNAPLARSAPADNGESEVERLDREALEANAPQGVEDEVPF